MFGRSREKAKRDVIEKDLLKLIKTANKGDVEDVLKKIDGLPSKSKESLKILKQEQGSLLDDVVNKFDPKVVLEIGFSGGCSAVRIANKMTKVGSKLLTVQVRAEGCPTATNIIEHAGLSAKVEVYNHSAIENEAVAHMKQFLGQMGARYFDFVFLDGYGNRYLRDFKFLKDKGMIGKGTVIVANTESRSTQNYLQYLKDHPEELETETYKSESTTAETNKSEPTSLTVSIYIVD